MRLAKYIDTRFDIIACPHAIVDETGVRFSDSFFTHRQELTEAFNILREGYGSAIAITSGYRCPSCQERLTRLPWYKAAKVSEHEFNAAYDVRPWKYRALPKNVSELAQMRREIMRMEYILDGLRPEIRIGTKLYDNLLMHIGVGYLLKPNPDPRNWVPGVRF